MATRKLDDPILNDLILMVQGRKFQQMSMQAQTRYTTHLDRIDVELKQARAASGNAAIGLMDTEVKIPRSQLDTLRGDLERLEREGRTLREQGEDLQARCDALARLETVLFEEFAEAMATVEGATIADVVIALLRAHVSHGEARNDAAAAHDPTGLAGGDAGDALPVAGAGVAAGSPGAPPGPGGPPPSGTPERNRPRALGAMADRSGKRPR